MNDELQDEIIFRNEQVADGQASLCSTRALLGASSATAVHPSPNHLRLLGWKGSAPLVYSSRYSAYLALSMLHGERRQHSDGVVSVSLKLLSVDLSFLEECLVRYLRRRGIPETTTRDFHRPDEVFVNDHLDVAAAFTKVYGVCNLSHSVDRG